MRLIDTGYDDAPDRPSTFSNPDARSCDRITLVKMASRTYRLEQVFKSKAGYDFKRAASARA